MNIERDNKVRSIISSSGELIQIEEGSMALTEQSPNTHQRPSDYNNTMQSKPQGRHNTNLSGSFLPDDLLGSADAMEYTPSNTSANNQAYGQQTSGFLHSVSQEGQTTGKITNLITPDKPEDSVEDHKLNQDLDVFKYDKQSETNLNLANLAAQQSSSNEVLSQDLQNEGFKMLSDLVANSEQQLPQSSSREQNLSSAGNNTASFRPSYRLQEEVAYQDQEDQSPTEQAESWQRSAGSLIVSDNIHPPQMQQEKIFVPLIQGSGRQEGNQSATPVFKSNSGAISSAADLHRQTSSNASPQTPLQFNPNNSLPSSLKNQLSARSQQQVPHGVINLNQAQEVDKLRVKTREQAQRLQQLEEYKQLCESRIRQLDPSQTLPLTPADLNKTLPQHKIPEVQNAANHSMASYQSGNKNLVNHLNQRIADLNSQLVNQKQLQQKVKQLEEQLRRETIQSEEQRAYIQMLKASLDERIEQLGINFLADEQNVSVHSVKSKQSVRSQQRPGSSRSSRVGSQQDKPRQIDGYLTLVNLQKQNEDLTQTNSLLHQRQQSHASDLQSALQEQRQAFENQMTLINNEKLSAQSKSETLQQEKDTLLDYVKETLDKTKAVEQNAKAEHQRSVEAQGKISILQQEVAEMEQQVKEKDELLIEVKKNIQEMRREKEVAQSKYEAMIIERDTMEKHKQDLDKQLQDTTKTFEAQIKTQSEQLNRVSSLEQDKSNLQSNIDTLNNKICELKSQLESEKDNLQSVQQSNKDLKITLKDTQNELSDLVNKYDNLTNSFQSQNQTIRDLKSKISDMQQEIAHQVKLINDLKAKEQLLEKEVSGLYSTLGRKEEVTKTMEQHLQDKLDKQQDETRNLKSQLAQVELSFKQSKDRSQTLEQTNSILIGKEAQLQRQLEDNKNLVIDLQRQARLFKEETQALTFDKEQTFKLQLMEKTQKEEELSKQVDMLAAKYDSLVTKKEQAENILRERGDCIDDLKTQIKEKEIQINRFEAEVNRLETVVGSGNDQRLDTQQELERVRGHRVDDAMLIDKMRIQQSEIEAVVNSVIGKLIRFAQNVKDEGKPLQTCEIEKAVKLGFAINPATSEVLETTKALEQINEFVLNLCQHTMKMIQQVPEREVRRSNHSTGNYASDYQFHSSPQIRNSTMNHSPHRLPSQGNYNYPQQLDLLHFDQDPVYQKQSKVTSRPESKLSAQQSTFELEEKQRKIDQLELSVATIRKEKQDFDSTLRLVLSLAVFVNPFKSLLADLVSVIKDIAQTSEAKQSLQAKISQKEQKYLTLNRTAQKQESTGSLFGEELVLLRSQIEREKDKLSQHDLQIECLNTKQTKLREDIQKANSRYQNKTDQIEVENGQLRDQVQELKKQRDDYREQIEWTKTRNQEQSDLLNRFVGNQDSHVLSNIKQNDLSNSVQVPQFYHATNRDVQRYEPPAEIQKFQPAEQQRKAMTDHDSVGSINTYKRVKNYPKQPEAALRHSPRIEQQVRSPVEVVVSQSSAEKPDRLAQASNLIKNNFMPQPYDAVSPRGTEIQPYRYSRQNSTPLRSNSPSGRQPQVSSYDQN